MSEERLIVISADGHAGGDIHDYRPYLASKWHDDFDAWAKDFVNPHEDLIGDLGKRNWDSDRRMRDLEADGQAAEVIFPNTVPPFYPNSTLTAQPPTMTREDQLRRWAGLQAHNRWLKDFCNAYPGRRAGIAQINLHNIEESVKEIRWAKENGLTGGIVLPGTPPGGDLPQLHEQYYEPLWQVCEELSMPVNHHTGSAAPPMGPEPVDAIMFLLEVSWYAHRAFYQLILAGAFERHPNLQLVFTEQGTGWVPQELMRLDYMFDRMSQPNGSQESRWGEEVMGDLTLKPSEYFQRQCHIGASFIRPMEVGMRHMVGVDRIMWGSDYPHKEASTPYSREAISLSFAGVPLEETKLMLSGNAARLYGFDLAFLKPIADRIGPRAADIFAGLPPRVAPKDADKCPAFIGYEFAA
ncbi:MAG: amidohydrolase [Ilumatobacteraceae bacterium]|jgi:predicted TIM-barrel fold metal-dependent hydrolase|nr:amidohydrolase [Ilumatobacteraceae bacterium]